MDKFGADDICVKAYDPEKKELIAVYDNFSQASRKLGISVKAIYAACASKSRRFSPFLNKEVALRSAARVQKSGD